MLSEISLMAWMSGAIVFAIGGGVGFYIARQVKDKHTLGLEKQLETTQNQLGEYQGEVNRHFLKTSLLFNKLTDDYREVYEHLATGAQKLCNDKPLAATLDLPETKILPPASASATIANEEKPAVEAITPAPSDTEHDDITRPDAEAMTIAETVTETVPIEDADLPKEAVGEPVETAQTHAESSRTEPSTTEETPTVAEAADATPAITEEELKTLEANEQKKNEEEDVPLGVESTPGVKPEHHKTHPSIH